MTLQGMVETKGCGLLRSESMEAYLWRDNGTLTPLLLTHLSFLAGGRWAALLCHVFLPWGLSADPKTKGKVTVARSPWNHDPKSILPPFKSFAVRIVPLWRKTANIVKFCSTCLSIWNIFIKTLLMSLSPMPVTSVTSGSFSSAWCFFW